MFKRILIAIGFGFILIGVYYPSRHARRYDYIPPKDIPNELSVSFPKIVNSNKNCSYDKVLNNNVDISIYTISDEKVFVRPLTGGEYEPTNCTPLERSAIIVPYRNRSHHLVKFINYMHWFLQLQQIHYRLIVVEQNDTLPFNRARMLNFGAKFAIESNFHCLILHDVDLLPINTGNLYVCSKKPRHISSSLDSFRYNLPYLSLFGGVVSITTEQFKKVNGMSNSFYGWGGEDDDFYRRLIDNDLEPCRFPPELSKFTMLMHEKQQPRFK